MVSDGHSWVNAKILTLGTPPPKVYPQASSRNFLVLHLPILLLPGP